jgi:hypothetical protein
VWQVTGWIIGLPGQLDPNDEERLHAIRARCPELDAAVRHVAGFARMIKDLSGDESTLSRCSPNPSPLLPKTWSPTANSVTAAPTASTSPANSLSRIRFLGRRRPTPSD